MVGVDAAGAGRHRARVRRSTAAATSEPARRFAAARSPASSSLVQDKFRVDELYDALIIRPIKRCRARPVPFVDRIIIDKILVEGIGVVVDVFARIARAFQGGDGQRYMAVFAVGVALLVVLRVAADAAVHQAEGDARPAARSTIDARRGPARAPTAPARIRRSTSATARPVVKGTAAEPRHDYDRAGQLHRSASTVARPALGHRRRLQAEASRCK